MKKDAVNVAANIATAGLRAIEGLISVPLVVSGLGVENFGLWALVSATTAYFLVFDFGVIGAIGRLIAAGKAKGEVKLVNEVVSTSMLMLSLSAMLTLIMLYFAIFAFFQMFDVPPEQQADVRLALVIVGLGV